MSVAMSSRKRCRSAVIGTVVAQQNSKINAAPSFASIRTQHNAELGTARTKRDCGARNGQN